MTDKALGLTGYTTKLLRVDLTNEQITEEYLSEDVLKTYIGGVGLGAKILYDEVLPGVEWDDLNNRLIIATGPMNGVRVAGTGTFCVVTKGPLTNGAASSQANGYFGAFLKLSGLDAIVIQGKAKKWLYLYEHDGTAELRDAKELWGKDTWETEELIDAELKKSDRELSVYSIGPAGENLVKFAALIGDKGHVAGHNGIGAVMGAKRLKAVAVSRGKQEVAVQDKAKLQAVTKSMIDELKSTPSYEWGTSFMYSGQLMAGTLPVKNLTTSLFPAHEKFLGENYRSRFELVKKHPCWACPAHHCDILKIKEGPYAGYIGEDPEYEGWSGWSSLIGSEDVEAAFVLCNMSDRLGFELNEAGWLMGFAIECYEKGLITDKDTDGLQLKWGKTEAVMAMLKKIASREGLGDVLAEGVMRAGQKLGTEAEAIGVYHKKGNAPRGHDHRARWAEMLDVSTGNTGTLETGGLRLEDPFSWEEVSTTVAKEKGIRTFVDSLSMCMICTNTMGGIKYNHLVDMLNAVTGWDFTPEDAKRAGLRTVNLMRAFNVRHGLTPEIEYPSARYSSTPIDGPAEGKCIAPVWEKMLDNYYKMMGWDRVSGKPLPETLESLQLGHIVSDLW